MNRSSVGLRAALSIAMAIALGALLPGAPSRAEIYKWVDANGRVHFSDKPQGRGAVSLDPKPARPVIEAVSEPSHPRGIAYRGKEPSRLMHLKSVRVLFEDVPPGRKKVIGTRGRGSSCQEASEIGIESGFKLDREASLQWHFHDRLQDLGYRSPKAFKTEFEVEGEQAPDFSVIAILTELEVEECSYRERHSDLKERNSTSLTVEWQVRDNLKRRLVYEATTHGSWRDTTFHVVSDQDPGSLERAFLEASGEFLSDPELVALLDPTPAIAAVSRATGAPALSVPIAEGTCTNDGPGFRERFETLRDGTATIRTAGGHGSGFLVSDRGYVLTNEHVVGRARKVVVVLGGSEYDASVVAREPVRDVALLQLSRPPHLDALPICRAGAGIGESVYIIGTPLNEKLALSVTKGIISQHRRLEDLPYYQTDASINQGNSGGPAFNEQGEVIGIAVAATFAAGGGGMGIGYLIPIDDALRPLLDEAPASVPAGRP